MKFFWGVTTYKQSRNSKEGPLHSPSSGNVQSSFCKKFTVYFTQHVLVHDDDITHKIFGPSYISVSL